MDPVPQRTLAHLRSSGPEGPRGELAKVIPRRTRVSWWLGLMFAVGFALLATPAITADRWLAAMGIGEVRAGETASVTVRVPAIAGFEAGEQRLGSGGIVIARGDRATVEDERTAAAVTASTPHGALPYIAKFLLLLVFAAIFTHHMRRSTRGRLVRVQVVSLVSIVALAVVAKVMLLATTVSVLVVPVALLAIVPTLALDRIVGLATGVLAALIVALVGPFDVGVSILLLVQVAIAGLVVAEQPKERWRAVLTAGGLATLGTAATYVLLVYLTTGSLRPAPDALHSAWLAAALGPAIATVLAVPLLPVYQILVGEITRGKLIELEDLSHPLLRQIAEKAPGTWQHSLMMANLAEIAANAIGASGRLVRVGAYFHDLGKSLQPKYFIENLDPGETSPHDKLSPEVSCDAIFAHVTEGIVTARKAGLHERIVDFMHMHHGNGVLEYFWGKCQEQGNPRNFTQEHFRYPGHPPQSRETAILAICDAVEAASRTLKKPDAQSIDSLVQRIVYGKLHLGQLDESGLSMSDLRRVSDSLRETIRHANHGRIEYPWQRAQQDASASPAAPTSTSPRLDSLDRAPDRRETAIKATPPSDGTPATTSDVALAPTADLKSGKTTGAPVLVKEVQPARQSGVHRVPSPPLELRQRAETESEDLHASRAATDSDDLPPHTPSLGDVAPAVVTVSPAVEDRAPARKRAATLPPVPRTRAPSVPPPSASRAPTIQLHQGSAPLPAEPAGLPPHQGSAPLPAEPTGLPPVLRSPIARLAGPPAPVDLDHAVTHPPPLRTPARPALLLVDEPAITSDESSSVDADDATRTNPVLARVRDDHDGDEWGTETPLKPPTPAELRSLLGSPDPTRLQSIEEIERLHVETREADTPEPELFSSRRPGTMPTTEVDPEDIEAAIEIAPPARRPASGAKKKSE
ncbi:MAG TPA: HDIG domain-containing protein [Kofleriaceae bacterium]|nr:HDIG domain-containing protein [Kofleriaceae bacterium]